MGLAGLTPDPAWGGGGGMVEDSHRKCRKKKKTPLKAAMSRQQQKQPSKASLTPSRGHQGALAGTASLNTVAGRPGTPPTLPSPPQGANADPLVLPDEHFTAITRGPSSPSLQAFFNRPRSLFYLFIYLFFSSLALALCLPVSSLRPLRASLCSGGHVYLRRSGAPLPAGRSY